MTFMTHQVKKEAFADRLLPHEEDDHFEIRWTEKEYLQNGEYIETQPKKEMFVFQKDKDRFLTKLIKDDNVLSIDVGTFNKIK